MSIKKNFFAPSSKGLGATRRAAMLLLVMMLTTVTTWADNYVTLTSTTTSWTNGKTYETNADVTIANRITVTGNVTLILTDGYTLSAPNGIEVRYPNSLTIKGGTNGTGTLTIEKNQISKAGIGGGSGKYAKDPVVYGNITINGGIVNVKGGAYGAGIGGNNNSSIDGCGTITINGGVVNATGGTGAAGIGGGRGYDGAKGGCGAIVINGGQVTATGGDDAPGIGPGKGDANKTSGSLVLGWTNTSDFIQVTGGNSIKNTYGFSNRLESISFAKDKKFNISGGKEATTDNIKNKVSLTLVPKGSEQYQLSAATISGISASYNLTGSSLDIPFSVSDAEGNTLTLGTDYTATLGTTSQESPTIHITEGGKYTLTITGKGSYAGSKSVDFEVISIGFKKDANGDDYINMPKTGIYYDAKIPEGVSSFNVYDDGGAKAQYSNNYNGGLVLTAPDHHVLQLTGTVKAEVWGKVLCDYLMVYDGGSTSAQKIGDKYGSDESGENIGTLISSGKQMTLTFHSDPSGQRDGLDLKVTLKRDIRSCDIANIDDQTYTGSAIEPDVTVTDGETTLTLGTDYEVAYSNNISAGTATITITGKENYAKKTSKTFNIVKATPTVTAPAAVDNLIYSGKNQALVVAGTTNFGTLLYSTDGNNYSKDIPTATDAGTYTVYYKVAGDDNHNDVSGSIEVTIASKAVTNDGITVTIPSQVWTGSELTPVITVKDGETELIKNTDYTVTVPSSTIQDAGDYTYTISGKGNYSGEKAATFTIIPKAVTNDGITIAAIADKTYTGSAIEPGVTVNDGEKTLTLGTDYTIGYSANVNVGTATATITGKGNYSGEKAATFTIIPKAVTNDGITIAAIADQTYTGSAIVPEVTVTDGETILTLETDYTIGYSANVNVGTATATITGMGNYTGSREVLFTIAKATTAVTTLTAVENLIYNGSAQALVNAGNTNFGTLLYSLDGQNYSDDIPTGTDAGTYTVYYKVEGSDNWNAVAAQTIEVTITYFDASLAAIVDNSDVISNIISNYDSKADVTLSDRTLYKDGNWNTLCLPFDVSDFTGTPLEGATAMELNSSTSSLDVNGVLTLNFTTATSIVAGKPYIIKWDKPSPYTAYNGNNAGSCSDIVNPVFTGVTVSNAKNDVAFTGGKFMGNYAPLEITVTGDNPNCNDYVVLAGNNRLGYVTTDRTIENGKALGAFRAYFYIPEKDGTTGASSFVLNFGDEETTTGIVDNKRETITNNHWYSLDGRKLDGKPTQKGLYIVNGKKVVIK